MWFLCLTEFIGAFSIAFFGSLAAKTAAQLYPNSKFWRAAAAGFVVFLVIWIVLMIGGNALFNPAAAVMHGMKIKLPQYQIGMCIAAQLLGFFLGWAAFRLLCPSVFSKQGCL